MELLAELRHYLLGFAMVVLALALLFSLIRAMIGPRFTDRIVAINMIGTQTILIVCILAFLIGEQYLVDIALVYAMISFLAVVALVNIYLSMLHERIDKQRRAATIASHEHAIEIGGSKDEEHGGGREDERAEDVQAEDKVPESVVEKSDDAACKRENERAQNRIEEDKVEDKTEDKVEDKVKDKVEDKQEESEAAEHRPTGEDKESAQVRENELDKIQEEIEEFGPAGIDEEEKKVIFEETKEVILQEEPERAEASFKEEKDIHEDRSNENIDENINEDTDENIDENSDDYYFD